jgi:hypothetical protein
MDINEVLQNAIQIIEEDVNKIQLISKADSPLERTEATKLTDYIKVLIIAQKNEREIQKAEGLDKLSDAELEEMTKEALRALEGDNK